MKHLLLTLFTLHSSLITLSAAVPLSWTVETTRAQPATFEAYQGETLALEASLQSYGKPLEASGIAALYWQTNGMGSTYWETTAAVNSNRLSAVFTPEMDVGAKVYNCFIGVPGTIYHAAFQLRLRPSPGAIPNVLPLPVPVIDFAKVRVLNPPWEGGGGGGGVNTNAVIDIIHATVDGAARPLPKYLHLYEANDSYPDAAAEYYRSRGNGKTEGGCSSVRDGNFLYRNFDYPFDDRAEFVVKMSAGPGRFASVGVAQVGTNLTEQMVTSGKPEYSRLYKWLPGATVDGINENGVACNINVVDGDPQTSGWHTNATSEAIHPLAAVRWILDHATNAQHAAEYLAANIRFPQGWTQNFHYMISDEREMWIVEDGTAWSFWEERPVITNFPYMDQTKGDSGAERYNLLIDGASITNAWYTNAYRRETNPPWVSDLRDVLAYTNDIYNAWATHSKEYFRGKTNNGIPWWQTVHTSTYDLTNRVLRVAVQEVDDWYVFQVPSSGAKVDSYTRAETDAWLAGKRDRTDNSCHKTERVRIFSLSDSWHFEIDEKDPESLSVIIAIEDIGAHVTWSSASAKWKISPIDVSSLNGYLELDQSVCEDEFATTISVRLVRRGVVLARAWAVRDSEAGDVACVSNDLFVTHTIMTNAVSKKIDSRNADGDGFVLWERNDGFPMFAVYGILLGTDGLDTDGDAIVSGDMDVFGRLKVDGVDFSTKLDAPAARDVTDGHVAVFKNVTNDDDTVTVKVEDGGRLPAISPTDPTFSNAVMGVASHTNADFAAEVLAVQVASLSTNITEEVYIAATNACANLGIDPALIPGVGTTGTVGGFIVMLFAVVFWMKRKIFDNGGKVSDGFAGELLGKPVAKEAIAYKVATASGENRSVLVVEIAETATAAVNVIVPAPVADKVIDFEVWVKVAARSTDIPQINYGYMVDDTFTPVTLIKKGGENPAYEKDTSAAVTNIVHFTSSDASGYTVVAAAFK